MCMCVVCIILPKPCFYVHPPPPPPPGGHLEVVNMLLNHGVDLHAANAGGTSAWHAAAQGPCVEVVEVLLKHGCEMKGVNKAGWNAAHFAASAGMCVGGVIMVYAKGRGSGFCMSKQKQQCSYHSYGYPPTHHPPTPPPHNTGQTTTLSLLLTAGVDPTIQCHAGRTPLHYAAQAGCTAAVDVLLNTPAARAMVDCVDADGWTALHHAAQSGSLETMQTLLRMSASCNIQSKQGHTPLHIAVSVGVEEVQVLLDAGVDQGLTDEAGCAAMHYAVQHGDHDVFVVLGGEEKESGSLGGEDKHGMVVMMVVVVVAVYMCGCISAHSTNYLVPYPVPHH